MQLWLTAKVKLHKKLWSQYSFMLFNSRSTFKVFCNLFNLSFEQVLSMNFLERWLEELSINNRILHHYKKKYKKKINKWLLWLDFFWDLKSYGATSVFWFLNKWLLWIGSFCEIKIIHPNQCIPIPEQITLILGSFFVNCKQIAQPVFSDLQSDSNELALFSKYYRYYVYYAFCK